MGCGCKKVAVGQAAAGPAVASPVRSYFVDQRGVREVTGMALPAKHQAAISLVGQDSGAANAAENAAVVPGLLIGAAGGIALAKTVLAAHPFIAAGAGIAFGTWYALSNLFDQCAPLFGPSSSDPAVVSQCQTRGAIVGAAWGAGAGLLLEGIVARHRTPASGRSETARVAGHAAAFKR